MSNPTVSTSFIKTQLEKSKKIEGSVTVGETTVYVIKGKSAIYKRQIFIRQSINDELDFDKSIGIAVRVGFLKEVLDWLWENKRWHSGGFTLTDSHN